MESRGRGGAFRAGADVAVGGGVGLCGDDAERLRWRVKVSWWIVTWLRLMRLGFGVLRKVLEMAYHFE